MPSLVAHASVAASPATLRILRISRLTCFWEMPVLAAISIYVSPDT